MSFLVSPGPDFASSLVRGVATLEPDGGPNDEDLSLTLGLSLWMHQSGTDLDEARATMLEIRSVILDVGGMDRRTEPVPLFGRAQRVDICSLATYLCDLVRRAACTVGCEPDEMAERVVARLGPHLPRSRIVPARAG
jgi:hypothetical protein